MLELNKIYNMDCIEGMKLLPNNSVDCIITSPPYNTGNRIEYWSNKKVNGKRVYKIEKRYDQYVDRKTDTEYIEWTIKLFESFDRIVKENGCVLYNISYGNETPNLIWNLIASILNNTNFCVADCIVWKKKSAVPNSTSKNKLTRICEFVFVFCRKDEFLTFNTNKKVKSISPKGQNFYEVFFNFIEAKNNDGSCDLNKATYSSELCRKLIEMYAVEQSTILDCFMGTGTTAVACVQTKRNYIGFELSKEQCEFAEKRIEVIK